MERTTAVTDMGREEVDHLHAGDLSNFSEDFLPMGVPGLSTVEDLKKDAKNARFGLGIHLDPVAISGILAGNCWISVPYVPQSFKHLGNEGRLIRLRS